jgi:DNA-binding NtrC family response regulator
MITADQARDVIELREEVVTAEATTGRGSQERRDAITYIDRLPGGGSFEKSLKLEKLAFYEDVVRSSGNLTKAAERLGMTHSALYHRMERLRRRVESD